MQQEKRTGAGSGSGDRAVESDAGEGELRKRRMRARRRTCANGGLQKGASEGRGRHRDRELPPIHSLQFPCSWMWPMTGKSCWCSTSRLGPPASRHWLESGGGGTASPWLSCWQCVWPPESGFSDGREVGYQAYTTVILEFWNISQTSRLMNTALPKTLVRRKNRTESIF